MILTRLELKNIKSYEDSGVILFAEGVNAISGPTGAGKSTILEAIGLALFGVRAHTQKRFMREGETSAEIVVGFIDSVDEREYQVVRPLGRGTPYIYDPEIERRIVTGVEDVFDWVKEHLKISPTGDLQALFKDAIGVPQGMLTASFLEGRTERKSKFDPLLQVDDYERAWTQLRETINHLKDLLQSQKERIAELRGELKQLPRLESELSELDVKINEDKKALEDVTERLDIVSTQKTSLDELQAQIEGLSNKYEHIANLLAGLNRQLTDAENAVGEAQKAQTIVNETESGYKAYQKAQESLQDLEGKRSQRDNLKDDLAKVDRELALARQRSEQLTKELDLIAEAETKMDELGPLVNEQTRLESELREAEVAVKELETARHRVVEESDRLIHLEDELKRVTDEIELLNSIELELNTLDTRRLELEGETASLNATQAQIEDQRLQLTERMSLLEDAEKAECPVCLQPLDEDKVTHLVDHYQAELGDLIDKRSSIQKRSSEIERELNEIKNELSESRNRTRTLSRPGRELELNQEMEKQQETLNLWKYQEEKLSGASDQISQLSENLRKLDDPMGKFNEYKVKTNERSSREAELGNLENNLSTHTDTRDQLIKKLESFVTLDADIKNQVQARDDNREDHDQYLIQLNTAQDLSKRRAKVEEIRKVESDTNEEKDLIVGALEEAQTGYDEATHKDLIEHHQTLNREQATIEGQLSLNQKRFSTLEDEIEALKPLELELRTLLEDHEFHQKIAEVLNFVRDTIRAAGPHVTRRLVEAISLQANLIFGDIMNDHTARLNWSEDYEINVEHYGNTRDFSQLSGGEKMATALAVRLALLQEMSDIRVAFFDEPTAHLDEERRNNLATQITQIKGFRQLFVISHDDTFERDIHHVLHVTKENGISQVEVG